MQCVVLCVVRVQVRDREIKVNIFDMAGHPFFYEVSHKNRTSFNYLYFLKSLSPVFPHQAQEAVKSCQRSQSLMSCNAGNLPAGGAVEPSPPAVLLPPLIILLLLLLLLLPVSQVRNEFYKDSQGVLLVYDVGLRESFDALDSWLGEMKQEMGSQANMDSIVFVVCANKVNSGHGGVGGVCTRS